MFWLRVLREPQLPDSPARQLRKGTVAPKHPGGQRVTDRIRIFARTGVGTFIIYDEAGAARQVFHPTSKTTLGHAGPLVPARRRQDHRALGEPRRHDHGTAARLDPAEPSATCSHDPRQEQKRALSPASASRSPPWYFCATAGVQCDTSPGAGPAGAAPGATAAGFTAGW